jgi:sulfur-carrier protein
VISVIGRPGGTIGGSFDVALGKHQTLPNPGARIPMAIEVKIPTILRTYTGGEKAVEAKGDTLAALIDDLDSRHPGLKGRLITDQGALHRFVNVYVNDEDVRFTGSLETALNDGDAVTILPAVAGG